MYNKIASIILNSGRNDDYAGEAYVAQPDANKERLAGKIFVLAEMSGRKSDAQKIISFLANVFEYNYYGDEKILLRDKLEELEVEDIFETVLAKVNVALINFLEDEKLRLASETTNFTLGVIYDNKLYFSTYGRNKAFLIYRRQGDYEILNVEMGAKDGGEIASKIDFDEDGEPIDVPLTKIFSSVVNGEIPPYSYFLFANEALPEYLSHGEMVNIITKLPPMVAAEQIKNYLKSINSFVPFLGIIVKSSMGGALNDPSEAHEEIDLQRQLAEPAQTYPNVARKAHSSISHLNYTEQKTEKMLASAGAISFGGVINWLKGIIKRLRPQEREQDHVLTYQEDGTAITPDKEKKRSNLPSRDSFLLKGRISFKKAPRIEWGKILNVLKRVLVIFTPAFWGNLFRGLITWHQGLNRQKRIMAVVVLVLVAGLSTSLVITRKQHQTKVLREQFSSIVAGITSKQGDIFRYAAVDNVPAALGVLNQAVSDLNNINPKDEDQIAQKTSLLQELAAENDRIQKIVRVNAPEEIFNISSVQEGAQADSLTQANGLVYVSDKNQANIYTLTLSDKQPGNISLPVSKKLSRPAVYEKNLYYLAGEDEVVKITGQEAHLMKLAQAVAPESPIGLYNNTLYVLDKTQNQIYRYRQSGNTFSSRSNWLQEAADLSQANALAIDGDIIIAQNNDDLLRFRVGRKQEYKSTLVDPAIRGDRLVASQDRYYLLDAQNRRLLVMNKGGVLDKQYLFDKDVSDFALSDDAASGFILSGNQVYQFSL